MKKRLLCTLTALAAVFAVMLMPTSRAQAADAKTYYAAKGQFKSISLFTIESGYSNVSYSMTESGSNFGTLNSGFRLTPSALMIDIAPAATGTAMLVTEFSYSPDTADRNVLLDDTDEPTPPSFKTTSLPTGTVGKAYSATVKTGGAAPVEVFVYYNPGKTNNFPSFLKISSSGKITGTPTKAGTYKFWLCA